MLEFVKGDFFDFDADIRINTVNCVGVMGAGVALAFKKKYPEMFKEYARECKEKEIAPGKPTVWKEGDMFSKGIEIINFPTKNHWRNPSKYEYIEDGLIWLSNYLKNKEGLTITLPALGCGHGGLDWGEVKRLILKYLKKTSNNILVFEPEASKNAGKNLSITPEKISELKSLGVSLVRKNEKYYPIGLTRYTEKDLWVIGNLTTEFDIAIISGTKPSEEEKSVVNELINYCEVNNHSVLFGGSAFDKRMATVAMKKGVKTGVFLPSGIYNSAEKMLKNKVDGHLSILSIGDPFTVFDKREYIPSVLSRMFICKSVIFTTDRLKWVKKQSGIILKNKIHSYFVKYEELQDDDYLAANSINSEPIKRIGFDFSIEIKP
ncbi:macro domain-containing protein [Alteromonas sp. 009811495]|uniref:macro domain-containing protein n=1 Tax=Alteromonas sp. 009811495 TaxID=3002962 RepID=UPI00237ECBC8|nr:macro domain-containing protein [Alteromonas sp. 009811495]WDT86988.1 macro domain-containing protein [Alteromonas sp. 009811495]